MARVYSVCLDGAPPTLIYKLSKDGTMPAMARILSNGWWTKALPSLPTVTSVNWTTIVSGMHSGSHGRPYSSKPIRYFWEALEEQGIPVGLANIEHNELADTSFYVSHSETISEAVRMKVPRNGGGSLSLRGLDGGAVAELEFSLSDQLDAQVKGRTKARIQSPMGVLSEPVEIVLDGDVARRACTAVRYDENSSELYVSPLRATRNFATPPRMEDAILDVAGLPPVKGFPLFDHGLADLETALEEERRHALWFARISQLLSRYEDALWFHRHNTTDGVGHFYLGLIDPEAFCYDPQNLQANWDAVRNWYRTVDLILATIQEQDPDAIFAMATDHGNIGYRRLISVSRALEERGLVVATTEKPRQIDRKRSRVIVGDNEIFVNTSARSPPGPVSPDNYESVREDVLEALRSIVDPQTSMHVVSIAVRREEASALKLWGAERGDIFFFLETGYFSPDPAVPDEVLVSVCPPGHSSQHHGCLPGYETEVGSMYSFMAFSIQNLKKSGPGTVHLVDFAPTVLSIFGTSAEWLEGRDLIIGASNQTGQGAPEEKED